MATLSYYEVTAALEDYEGQEQSSAAQQYLNSIAGDVVVLPTDPAVTVPASQALYHKKKIDNRLTIIRAAEENPPRILTREDVDYASSPRALPTIGVDGIVSSGSDLQTALEALDGQALADFKSRLGGAKVAVYDLYGNTFYVRAADMLAYLAKGHSVAYPTCAVTGTAIASGVAEAEIVSGSETLIFTLTNGTWAASGTVFNALRASFLAYLRAGGAEAAGWDAEVVALLDVSQVVRTSDTVVTITLPAAASYSIAADEDVALGVPAGAVVNNEDGTLRVAVTPSPAEFTITAA